MAGGCAIGFVGGHALSAVINRLSVAPGLYPILALAGALFLFGGAQTVGASGFVAVYLAGLILGNRPHRAEQSISRFHDGIDRKSVGSGKRVSVRVDLGGGAIIKKKK